jgi:hypothetical protein
MNDVLKRSTAAAWDLTDASAVGLLRAPCTAAPLWEPHFNYGTLLLRKVGTWVHGYLGTWVPGWFGARLSVGA